MARPKLTDEERAARMKLGGRASIFTDDQVADALRRAHCNYSLTCRLLDEAYNKKTGRTAKTQSHTIGKRVKETPELQELVTQIRNESLDLAEERLFDLIKEGNVTAIIFYLKCQGKGRGYIERYDHRIDGQIDHRHAHLHVDARTQLGQSGIDLSQYSDDQLAAIEDFSRLIQHAPESSRQS